MKELRGGFTKGVVKSNAWARYVGKGENVWGYIGASNRTILLDKIVEKILREQGLKDEGIATWLTSGEGRHLMDDMPSMKNIKKVMERVADYTDDAFKKVTVWSHPDHDGMRSSTIDLMKKIFGEGTI
jgi:hypothetical protein